MSAPAKPNQLQLEWLDALLVLRRGLEADGRGREVLDFVDAWEGIQILDELQRVMVTEDTALGVIELAVPGWSKLAKIERLEILLYTATGLWFWKNYPGNPFEYPREAFQHLCFRVGCWHTNTPSVRERWRLIDWKIPAHMLPLASHEDRPKCRLCSLPVATEAGSWTRYADQGEAHGLERAGDGRFRLIDNEYCTYRADLHEECDRYIHRVMIPARLEQIKIELPTKADSR